MTELAISILTSSLLFILFRLFPKYGVDTAQAIVVNYFTAFICGCIVSGSFPDFKEFTQSGIVSWTVLTGFLLISLFIGMGISSVKNGIGTTSVTVKMSMVLSTIFLIITRNEGINLLTTGGFILAAAGIALTSFQRESGNKSALLLLIFLFAGSSVLDLVLNHVQKFLLNDYPGSMYTAFGFLVAGLTGAIWISTEFYRKKRTFAFRNIPAGIILGIPNYFSIYFLVRSYSTTGFSDSTTLAVTSISIVSLSSVFGMAFFKESTSLVKTAGLACCLAAILLLTADRKSEEKETGTASNLRPNHYLSNTRNELTHENISH